MHVCEVPQLPLGIQILTKSLKWETKLFTSAGVYQDTKWTAQWGLKTVFSKIHCCTSPATLSHAAKCQSKPGELAKIVYQTYCTYIVVSFCLSSKLSALLPQQATSTPAWRWSSPHALSLWRWPRNHVRGRDIVDQVQETLGKSYFQRWRSIRKGYQVFALEGGTFQHLRHATQW